MSRVTFRQGQAAALAVAAMLRSPTSGWRPRPAPDRNHFAIADRRWSRAGVRCTAATT
jgi:hypothetical protein